MTDSAVIVSIISASSLIIVTLITLIITKRVKMNQSNIDKAEELAKREKDYIMRLESAIKEYERSETELKSFLRQCREERLEAIEKIYRMSNKNNT